MLVEVVHQNPQVDHDRKADRQNVAVVPDHVRAAAAPAVVVRAATVPGRARSIHAVVLDPVHSIHVAVPGRGVIQAIDASEGVEAVVSGATIATTEALTTSHATPTRASIIDQEVEEAISTGTDLITETSEVEADSTTVEIGDRADLAVLEVVLGTTETGIDLKGAGLETEAGRTAELRTDQTTLLANREKERQAKRKSTSIQKELPPPSHQRHRQRRIKLRAGKTPQFLRVKIGTIIMAKPRRMIRF